MWCKTAWVLLLALKISSTGIAKNNTTTVELVSNKISITGFVGSHRIIKRFAPKFKFPKPQLPIFPRPTFPFPVFTRERELPKGDDGERVVTKSKKGRRPKPTKPSQPPKPRTQQEDRTLLAAKKAIILKKAILAKKAIILAKMKKKAFLKKKKKLKKLKKKAVLLYGLNQAGIIKGFSVKAPSIKVSFGGAGKPKATGLTGEEAASYSGNTGEGESEGEDENENNKGETYTSESGSDEDDDDDEIDEDDDDEPKKQNNPNNYSQTNNQQLPIMMPQYQQTPVMPQFQMQPQAPVMPQFQQQQPQQAPVMPQPQFQQQQTTSMMQQLQQQLQEQQKQQEQLAQNQQQAQLLQAQQQQQAQLLYAQQQQQAVVITPSSISPDTETYKGSKKAKKKAKKKKKVTPRPVDLGVKANLYKKFDGLTKKAQKKLSSQLSSFIQIDIDFFRSGQSGRAPIDSLVEPGRFVQRTARIPQSSYESIEEYDYVSGIEVPANFVPSWEVPSWSREYPAKIKSGDTKNCVDDGGRSSCKLEPVYILFKSEQL